MAQVVVHGRGNESDVYFVFEAFVLVTGEVVEATKTLDDTAFTRTQVHLNKTKWG